HGTAAALYFGDSGKAVVLTGMPGAPQIVREVALDGPPVILAVSDDGAGLAAVVNLADKAMVYSYSADAAGQVLLSAPRFPSLEFVPGSGTILMATESSVYLYRSSQGLQLLADQRDGIADVAGAAASGDGALVVIAMRSGQV